MKKRPLYRAFNKYGITNFVIRELEYVQSDAEACEREIYWIDFSHHVTKLDDGMEICIIDFEWNPMPFIEENY